MRLSLSLKTLFRSPVRTILTFILLGVVTFALFSQVTEYVVTKRELENAAAHYYGVGAVEAETSGSEDFSLIKFFNADPIFELIYSDEEKARYLDNNSRYQPLTVEEIKDISALPYITSTDLRYMTAGYSEQYARLCEGNDFYDHTTRCVIEGTLTEIVEAPPIDVDDITSSGDDRFLEGGGEYCNQLYLEDCKLLAGDPQLEERQQLKINANPFRVEEGAVYFSAADSTEVHRYDVFYTDNYIYDTEYIDNLALGERYVFILRTEPLSYEYTLYLSDAMSEPWCSAVWPLDDEPENYLESEKFASVCDLIEIIDADRNTFDMVYTEDMRSIKNFVDDEMFITEGRTLTPEDSATGANVCVISRQFAKAYGLSVGDTIDMKLGDELFSQLKGLGALAIVRERYEPAAEEVTLEIVGLFADTTTSLDQSRAPHQYYSVSTVFVPKSLLPVDESRLTDHEYSPSEFSFKVDNPWDILAFLDETLPMLEAMGYTVFFDDAGWPEIANAFAEAKVLLVIKIAVMAAVVAMVTSFVVYLFIGRRKKQYAVMRALGTPGKTSARALVLPLTAVTFFSAVAGSAAGWAYMVRTIEENKALATLENFTVNTAIPWLVAVLCTLAVFLLTVLIALFMLRRIGRIPPLALLQDNMSRQKRKKSKMKPGCSKSQEMPISENPISTQSDAFSGIPVPSSQIRQRGSIRFVLRYIGRHIRRTAGKSMLAITLAALLFAAVGQFSLMKQSYVQLIENTVITAQFYDGPKFVDMTRLQKKPYAKDLYYEGLKYDVDINGIQSSVIITNDIAQYLDEDVKIEFADGYDESSLTSYSEITFFGAMQMAAYGLEPGDKVTIIRSGLLQDSIDGYIQKHRMENPDDERTDEEIIALYSDELMESASLWTREYTIAGVITSASGKADDKVFAPGLDDLMSPLGSVKLDKVEATLADNWRADDLRSYCEGIAAGAGAQLVMDTEKLDSLMETYSLLETLYPIAVAATLVIGGFLCCLVILQSSKEAAILRILGTTKRKTLAILSLEQIFLSVIGLVVGAIGLLIYKGTTLTGILNQLLLFAGLYFAVIVVAAVICGALSTRRNVLELLQTKE